MQTHYIIYYNYNTPPLQNNQGNVMIEERDNLSGNVTQTAGDLEQNSGLVSDSYNARWNVLNSIYPLSFQFTKQDTVTGSAISGSMWELCRIDNALVVNPAIPSISDPLPFSCGNEEVSDVNGLVKFTNNELGYYALRETQPANGYLPNNQVYLV